MQDYKIGPSTFNWTGHSNMKVNVLLTRCLPTASAIHNHDMMKW